MLNENRNIKFEIGVYKVALQRFFAYYEACCWSTEIKENNCKTANYVNKGK